MRAWLAAVPLVLILYFHGLTAAGMLGPDEPRYASIGREMARSGDWITPRLWGEPWFEKPALLYWMTGAGFKAGLGDDLAPRLPVALLAVAFLVFYQRTLARQFNARAAWFATAILATSAMWLAFSRIGVTDLPLTVTFSAAMLLGMDWAATGDRRRLPWMGALFGAAVLAKGLLPLVLAAPLAWSGRRRLKDLLHPRVWLPFAAVAVPWYLLCWMRNGDAFIDAFFWRHHVERFSSTALQHQQPFWFYLPVLAGALVPWTPLAALLFRRGAAADPRRAFLLLWAAFGLIFLSASTNKLPGYVLPLMPALAALMGVALAERKRAPWLLAASAALLAAIPVAAVLLPRALAAGLSRAGAPAFHWTWLAPFAVAAIVWVLERRGQRAAAFAALLAAVATGFVYLERTALPQIDLAVSARPVWREIAGRRDQVCVEDLHRSWRYGLNYYSGTPLAECATSPRPYGIEQEGAGGGPPAPPRVTARPVLR